VSIELACPSHRLPSRCRYATVTLSLRYRYATVTLPLRCEAAASWRTQICADNAYGALPLRPHTPPSARTQHPGARTHNDSVPLTRSLSLSQPSTHLIFPKT